MLIDLRCGIRTLLKSPGFTAVAVITLALGIGANTAIFSVVNAVLLRPLPYKQSDQLVTFYHKDRWGQLSQSQVLPNDFLQWKNQNQVFEGIAATAFWGELKLTVGDEPASVLGGRASADLFPLLDAKPMLGRIFLPEECQPGKDQVVILTHDLWLRRFGGDPSLLGKAVILGPGRGYNGVPLRPLPYTVVGIMPPDFQYPPDDSEIEMWRPLVPLAPDRYANGSMTVPVVPIGRLKSGVSLKLAQGQMDTIPRRPEQPFAHTYSGQGITLVSLHDGVVKQVRPALLLLLGAVGFVLLIACVNVANLLLARGAARQKETATRAALGASRSRLVRLFLSESVLLALLGGGLGFLLCLWGIDLLVALIPVSMNVPFTGNIRVNSTVLGFNLAISLLTGLVFGLAPALQGSKLNLCETLKEGSRTTTGSFHRNRLLNLLVISEIALALVLLIGAGLMINSFLRLRRVNPGFNPENVLLVHIERLPEAFTTGHKVVSFYQQVLQRVEALPGVLAAAAASDPPLDPYPSYANFSIEGHPPISIEEWTGHNGNVISPNYFRLMGIPLRKGRYFTEQDRVGAPGVAIIDEQMARRYWPNEDPIGKRLKWGGPNAPWLSIVGVVGDVKRAALDAKTRMGSYLPYLQVPEEEIGEMSLVVRTANPPIRLAPAVRSEIRAVDKEVEHLSVTDIKTLEQVIAESTAPHRFRTWLLGLFAFLALTLAAAGIYAVMSYLVAWRRHEIGIRMALGAQEGDVLKLVVGQGMILALIGLTIGLVGAFVLTRLLSSFLYELTATDPVTFLGVSFMLAVVALLACYIPARRATKVDPMVALRYE